MNIIHYIFTATIALAPLPFGLVYGVMQAGVMLLVMGLVIAYCGLRLREGKGPAVAIGRLWPECVLFAGVVGWGFFQVSGLMAGDLAHPLWGEAGAVLGVELSGALSLARGDGFAALMRMLMYGAVFWLALQVGRDRQRARQVVGVVVAAATIYAVYGLVVTLGGFEKVLWVDKSGTALSGTFVNRNNFATYLGLGLLCAAGMYLGDFFRALESSRMGRDRTAYIVQQAFVRGAPQLACILIMLTALFLTQSRGGITCALIALGMLVVLMGLLNRMRSRVYQVLTGSLVVFVLAVFLFSGDGWLERLTGTELERETRFLRFEQTWAAIGHAPVTGYGVGSFEATFPVFADERTITSVKAHNDWLEMMFTLGIPAAIAWFAVIGGFAVRCLAGFFRRGRDQVYPAVGFCAAILVGLHSLVDFSLQIPAVAITFAVLLGVGVGQAWGGGR